MKASPKNPTQCCVCVLCAHAISKARGYTVMLGQGEDREVMAPREPLAMAHAFGNGACPHLFFPLPPTRLAFVGTRMGR